jgi:small-conductance mechanosensitive channel
LGTIMITEIARTLGGERGIRRIVCLSIGMSILSISIGRDRSFCILRVGIGIVRVRIRTGTVVGVRIVRILSRRTSIGWKRM